MHQWGFGKKERVKSNDNEAKHRYKVRYFDAKTVGNHSLNWRKYRAPNNGNI